MHWYGEHDIFIGDERCRHHLHHSYLHWIFVVNNHPASRFNFVCQYLVLNIVNASPHEILRQIFIVKCTHECGGLVSRLIRYLDWKASEIDVAATFFCHPATYMDVKQREMQGTISPELYE